MPEKFSKDYKKELTLFHLVMLNAMSMIGSGWLFASLYASSYAGSLGSIFSWIIAGAIVILMALTFMEVTPAFPLSGGSAPIGELSHGKLVGFIVGWSAWLSDVMTPPIEAIALVTYASFYVNGLISSTGTLLPLGYLFAIIAMIIMFIVNLQAVKIFGNITSGIMIWKWAIPLLAAITLITVAFHPSNFVSYGYFYQGYSGIFYAMVLGGIIFSFEGFRGSVIMAAEAKRKDYIWKSVIIAVIAVLALYVILDIAFVGALNWSAAGVTPGDWGALRSSSLLSGPFAQEAAAAGLGWLVVILIIDAIVSPGGTGISFMAYPARIFQAMAEFGYAPKYFAKLHEKTKIPARAVILNFLVGLIFIYEFPGWSLLVGILTSTLVVAYVMGPAAVNVLRRTAPEVERPFRLKGSKIIAPIAFIFTFLVIYWSGWPLSGEVVLAVLAGLVMFAYFYRKNKFSFDEIKSGIWIIVLLIFVAIFSYIGPSDYGGINIIPFPWDFIVLAIVSLFIYFWAQRSGRRTKTLEEYLQSIKNP